MNRNLIKFVLVFIVSFMPFQSFSANDWPQKRIQFTVGFGAGGTTDATSRLLASILEQELGQNISVVNKPGGGGIVAAGLSRTARPDGYSIFTAISSSLIVAPHMQAVPYDSLKDFTYIAQFAQWNLGIVVPKDAPYDTFPEFIKYAKNNPGKVSYSVSGAGTMQHIMMQRLASIENIDWKVVPYKGGADAVTALLGGHVTAMAGATEWLPQVQSGDFKLLAIFTNKKMKQFPDVPTLVDLGYDISAPSFVGIAGPAGMPKEVVDKLSSEIEKATQKQEFIDLIDKLAMQVGYMGPEEFTTYIHTEYETQEKVLKEAGLTR